MSSFYINRTRSGWRVVEESYQNGKRKQLTVPRLAYSVLGLRSELTLEEARTRVTEYNKTKKLQNAVGAAKRYVEDIKIKSAFLNVTKTQEFSKYLENYHFGSAKHHQRIMHEWSFIQKLIADLKLSPEEYSDNRCAVRAQSSHVFTNRIRKALAS